MTSVLYQSASISVTVLSYYVSQMYRIYETLCRVWLSFTTIFISRNEIYENLYSLRTFVTVYWQYRDAFVTS